MQNRAIYIAAHCVGAGAVFFSIQKWFMKASLETCLIWAAAGAIGAALLAWTQTRR